MARAIPSFFFQMSNEKRSNTPEQGSTRIVGKTSFTNNGAASPLTIFQAQ
jgi:hypothetical protein